jgi:4-amino-4-deoxy-L-arabinose transferase-like glycosyltransferase
MPRNHGRGAQPYVTLPGTDMALLVRRPLIPLLVLAGGLRFAWVLLVPNGQYSDSVWYDGAAANLAASGIYGPDGVPSAWFPPGYPLFLAALYKFSGHEQLVGKLANVALGVAMTACTYALARRVADQTVATISALFVALWPNLIFSTGILGSDILAATGFVAAMWFGMRRPRLHAWQTVLLGLLIGWMVLVRPVSLILLAALGLWWWLEAHSLKTAVVRLLPLTALAAVMVAAWTIRNYVEFGQPIAIATNGGYNFWQTNHRYADGNDTYWQSVPMDDPEYQTMRNGDEFTKNREGYRYALAYLRAHPTHLLTMMPTKLFWLYHSDTSGFYEGALYPPMEGPSALAAWIAAHDRLVESSTFRYYAALMVLASAGALLLLARQRPLWMWPLLSLPALLTVFHLFFHAKDRFHIPLDGVIAVFAAVAVVEVARLVRRAAWPSLAVSTARARRPGGA